MGVSLEQWRAATGRWLGGATAKCLNLETCCDQSSQHKIYKQIRFILLISLLVIGCVETNPGPDQVRYIITDID
jgi:hypothetical protein